MAEKWEVTKKIRTTILFGGSEPVSGYRIWYHVPETDTHDYIEVTESENNAKTIKKRIDDAVANWLETYNL